jgi:hypothetical protein
MKLTGPSKTWMAGNFHEQSAGIRVAHARVHVPGQHLFHGFERFLGTVLGLATARSPNPERHDAVADYATDPKRIEVAEVVGMQVTDKDLVDEVVRDLER